MICHGRPGRMSPGLVMAGTGGNPGSPRCLTYEPGFIPGRDRTESAMKNSQRAGSQDDRAGTARMRRWSEEKLSVRLFAGGVRSCPDRGAGVGRVVRVRQPECHVDPGAGVHRRRRRSCPWGAAVLDVTISLTGSAGLRQAWPRRALAIARAGVAVVAVAASGDGSACPSVPADRAISGAPGCLRCWPRRSAAFRGRDAGAGWEQRPGPASGRAVRFVMGGLGGCHRDW